MAIDVSIVEDDAQARKILAGWIGRASGFRLAGEWGDAESALNNIGLLQQKIFSTGADVLDSVSEIVATINYVRRYESKQGRIAVQPWRTTPTQFGEVRV